MERKVLAFPNGAGGNDGGTIDHMLARGEIMPTQLPTACTWSREKKLAAAAFTSALINIRDNAVIAQGRRHREVQQDIEWVMNDDATWPYSFLRLCELFSMDAAWVRDRVRHWVAAPRSRTGQRFSAHRHAA